MSYEFTVRLQDDVLPTWARVLDGIADEFPDVAVVDRNDAPVAPTSAMAIDAGYSLVNDEPTSIAIVPDREAGAIEVILSASAGDARLVARLAATLAELAHGSIVLHLPWMIGRM